MATITKSASRSVARMTKIQRLMKFPYRFYQDLLIRRPPIEPQMEVVESTANGHDHIASRILPQPDRLFEYPTALDTANNVFNPHSPMGNRRIFGFLIGSEFFLAWFLVWLGDRDGIEHKSLETQILK